MLDSPIKKEFKRKIFHLFSLGYALGYYFLGRNPTVIILGLLLAVESAIEFGRFFFLNFNSKLVHWFGGIHREQEFYKSSGIFWTLLGSLVIIGLFPNRSVVLCSMGYLIFGDSAAALVGVRFGRHKIGKKSVEGTLAFFCISFLIGLFFLTPLTAFLGAIFVALIELVPLPYNDNFWIPVFSAIFLTAITIYL